MTLKAFEKVYSGKTAVKVSRVSHSIRTRGRIVEKMYFPQRTQNVIFVSSGRPCEGLHEGDFISWRNVTAM